MFHLWCSGIKGTCNTETGSQQQRFHMTCLYCRFRRRFYAKMTEPNYWIRYTYLSVWINRTTTFFDSGPYRYRLKNGKLLRAIEYTTLNIDPRGPFVKLRCAAIIVIDRLMLRFGKSSYGVRRDENGVPYSWGVKHDMRRPFAEICELLSCYP